MSAQVHVPSLFALVALAEVGATPAVICESPGYAVVCALVSAGIGVAVVPEMVASMAAAPLSIRRLEPASFRRTISVVHRGDRSSAPGGRCCALSQRFRPRGHGPGGQPGPGGLTRWPPSG
ncbi:hypothetical protein SBADM41S_02318 [Streptomyces badius]